jgi:ADP-ribosylglycohydrolase
MSRGSAVADAIINDIQAPNTRMGALTGAALISGGHEGADHSESPQHRGHIAQTLGAARRSNDKLAKAQNANKAGQHNECNENATKDRHDQSVDEVSAAALGISARRTSAVPCCRSGGAVGIVTRPA